MDSADSMFIKFQLLKTQRTFLLTTDRITYKFLLEVEILFPQDI